MMHRFSALLVGAACTFAPFAVQAEPAVVIPPPAVEAPAPPSGLETAVLAGGCFWGVQAVYQHVKGVTNTISGYAGGEKRTPNTTSSVPVPPATPKACR
jgi:peptide-methionine (S)-S-oxide reductase